MAFYESTERSQRHSRGLVGRLRRIFFTHVDAVLTVGRASTSAVQHLGVKPGRIVVTHNSVDLDVYKSADIHSPVLPRGTSFAYVGQLLERKNVLTLIDALTLMPDECTLDVVGEGPLDSAVRCAIDEGGLHDRVTLHGYLEPISVAALLGRVGTLVLPSTEEVYGLAPAEALAAGLHVVVSDKAGIAPDIDTMDGVWICEPTVDALAAAMRSSTLAWSGPIKSPAIREWTAGRFAQDVLTAADIARHRTI